MFPRCVCVCMRVSNHFTQLEIYICVVIEWNIGIGFTIQNISWHSFCIYSFSILLCRIYKSVFCILALDYLVAISINFIARVSTTTTQRQHQNTTLNFESVHFNFSYGILNFIKFAMKCYCFHRIQSGKINKRNIHAYVYTKQMNSFVIQIECGYVD